MSSIANEKLGFEATCQDCLDADAKGDICCDFHFKAYQNALKEEALNQSLNDKTKSTVVGAKFHNGPTKPETQKFVDIMATPIEVAPHEAKAAAILITNPNAIDDPAQITKDSTAFHQAKRLQASIEKRKKVATMFANVTPEMVIGATAIRAFADPTDAFDDEGNFDFKKAVETGAIYVVKKFKKWHDKDGNPHFEVEFYSQESAQDRLGNYLGIEKAPVQSNDESSLKAGIETIAQKIAALHGRTEVTGDDRLLALEKVVQWAKESKARYPDKVIEKVVKEVTEQATGNNGG